MNRIYRHLSRALIRGGIPVLLLLLGVFGFFTLAEELEDVGKGDFGVVHAVRLTAYSLPALFVQVLPVCCLLGTVLGYGGLARNQELIALRSAGHSPWRIATPAVLIGAALGVTALILQQIVIPTLDRRGTDLEKNAIGDTATPAGTFWTRLDNRLLRVGYVRLGVMPMDIEVFTLANDGRLNEVLRASQADVLDDTWRLYDVRVTALSGMQATSSRYDTLDLPVRLTSSQIGSLMTNEEALPPSYLIEYIQHLRANDLDAHRYAVHLWQKLSLPVGIVGMTLLGIPFVLGSVRTVSLGSRIALASLIGLVFYLVERTATQTALLYHWPAAPVAMIPDIAVALTGAVLIRKMH